MSLGKGIVCVMKINFAHLFVKLPQLRDLCSLCVKMPPVTTSLTTQTVKGSAILVRALSNDTTSELASLSSHYPFNAECQAGKL